MLHLYNTLSKKKEEFIPINPGKVSMYACGPTVYGYQHIGNYKSFMTADVLRRYLSYLGYEVRYIQNITDVGHLTDDDVAQGDHGEDKMIKKALQEKKTPEEIAEFYTNYHIDTSRDLNMEDPHLWPRATAHVPHMIAMIEELIKKGHAYESNGNVFLDVTSFPDYGKLSGNTLENLNVGARLEEPHPDKRSQWDFALWLTAPKEHLMQWSSPWSRGYPGWHIECSAMSTEYLGETFDIHTGGEDHIFPHHEAEIVQSEGVTEKPFVHYWLHTRHMLIEGKKMSKSKGNIFTLEDVKDKGFSSMDLRMTYLLSHYRSQMNFTWDSVAQAQKNRKTLEAFMIRLHNALPHDSATMIDVIHYHAAFDDKMNDDLNTPGALAVLLELVTVGNKALDASGIENNKELLAFMKKAVCDVFGLRVDLSAQDIPHAVTTMAQERTTARKDKDFDASDRLRTAILEAGYLIEDTADGYTLTKK